MKKKYVLKNRRRFSLFIGFLVVIASVMVFATSVYGSQEVSYKEVTVRAGDTLWSIARSNDNKGDIRKYIYEIKKVNNLSTSEIFEGTTLILPEA